jgi:hypothetical protein
VVVLLGLIMAAVVLYVWLAGNWFGRILAAFVFVPLGAWAGVALLAVLVPSANIKDEAAAVVAVACAIAGAVGGWQITGLPMWHWQRRARMLARA